MTLATTCPRCGTSFKVVPDQLKLRRGLLRCGACRHVFSGLEALTYLEDGRDAAASGVQDARAAPDQAQPRPDTVPPSLRTASRDQSPLWADPGAAIQVRTPGPAATTTQAAASGEAAAPSPSVAPDASAVRASQPPVTRAEPAPDRVSLPAVPPAGAPLGAPDTEPLHAAYFVPDAGVTEPVREEPAAAATGGEPLRPEDTPTEIASRKPIEPAAAMPAPAFGEQQARPAESEAQQIESEEALESDRIEAKAAEPEAAEPEAAEPEPAGSGPVPGESEPPGLRTQAADSEPGWPKAESGVPTASSAEGTAERTSIEVAAERLEQALSAARAAAQVQAAAHTPWRPEGWPATAPEAPERPEAPEPPEAPESAEAPRRLEFPEAPESATAPEAREASEPPQAPGSARDDSAETRSGVPGTEHRGTPPADELRLFPERARHERLGIDDDSVRGEPLGRAYDDSLPSITSEPLLRADRLEGVTLPGGPGFDDEDEDEEARERRRGHERRGSFEPTWREIAASAYDDAPEAAVDFLSSPESERSAASRAFAHSMRALVVIFAVLALLQLAIVGRNWIAALWPESRPVLGAVLAPLGLEVGLPRRLNAVSIESFELQADRGPERLILQAVLRNQAPYPVQWPALELRLTDAEDQLVVRRVILPADFLPDERIEAGFAPASEHLVTLQFSNTSGPLSGYSASLFYP